MNRTLWTGMPIAGALLLIAACSDSGSTDTGGTGGTGGTSGGTGGAGATGGTSGTGGTAGGRIACTTEEDCTGGTSHCDTARGVCTGCSTDADCRGSLYCDADTGICRDCATDAHCGGTRPICDAVSGQCTANCSTLTDCASTGGPSVCDTTRGVCVDCVASVGGCMCELVTFSCVGCLTDSDCPSTAPFCGPSHECSPECTIDDDCPAGLFCDTASRRCVECAINAHCGGETCQVDYTCG